MKPDCKNNIYINARAVADFEMADLSTSICGMKLRSPLILASGITDTTGASLLRAIRNGAGAAIIKSVSVEPREGHKGHVVQEFDDLSMINAMGLPNQGIKHAIDELIEAQKRTDAPLIANIYAGTVEDFGLLAREISKAKPAMIEVNISCPNVHDEFGTPFSALFFSSRRRHTRLVSDWSSDVCSSD